MDGVVVAMGTVADRSLWMGKGAAGKLMYLHRTRPPGMLSPQCDVHVREVGVRLWVDGSKRATRACGVDSSGFLDVVKGRAGAL